MLHRDEGRLIPDFFVERLDSRFCDVVDLKRPDVTLARGSSRKAVSAAVMDAVAQLQDYRTTGLGSMTGQTERPFRPSTASVLSGLASS